MVVEKYLFCVSMHNTGSTLFERVLRTSSNVINLPIEGDSLIRRLKLNFIPARFWNYKRIFAEIGAELEDPKNYNWKGIKQTWEKHWKQNEKYGPLKEAGGPIVYLERSSPNMYRYKMLSQYFPDPYFIVNVRNPYAVAEGTRRRMGYKIKRIAKHWIAATKKQIEVLETAKNVVSFTYEEFCEDPHKIKDILLRFLPELKDIDVDRTFKVHTLNGVATNKIQNYNEKQFANLTKEDLEKINPIFEQNLEVLEKFGYTIRK